ncbi:hypothetical protein EVAR_93829_1 [Eumeta japonica]|uniref:Uncharacterized protein n=1 Tax=Eumeta variegata TaxID=151549 RepID=A0A4C1TWN3_EUMVA|nr:hypothetical protein EVAR_93829_1 [Eumeta japonica]
MSKPDGLTWFLDSGQAKNSLRIEPRTVRNLLLTPLLTAASAPLTVTDVREQRAYGIGSDALVNMPYAVAPCRGL